MPNIAAVLKERDPPFGKKEVKAQVGTTKHAVGRYRGEIARLKRAMSQQEREIKLLEEANRSNACRRRAGERAFGFRLGR